MYEQELMDAIRLINSAYLLAPKSTPANLRRTIVEAMRIVNNYEPPDPPGFEAGFADNH